MQIEEMTEAPYLSTASKPSSTSGNDSAPDNEDWESLASPPATEDEGDAVVSEVEISEEESLPDIAYNVHHPVREHESEGSVRHQDPDSAPDAWEERILDRPTAIIGHAYVSSCCLKLTD